MTSDDEYARIARAEAHRRIDGILHAIGEETAPTTWATIHRHAHSLAGLGPDLDREMARDARRLTELVVDPRGRIQDPTPERAAEAKRIATRLAEQLARLDRTLPPSGGQA